MDNRIPTFADRLAEMGGFRQDEADYRIIAKRAA